MYVSDECHEGNLLSEITVHRAYFESLDFLCVGLALVDVQGHDELHVVLLQDVKLILWKLHFSTWPEQRDLVVADLGMRLLVEGKSLSRSLLNVAESTEQRLPCYLTRKVVE